MAIIDKVREDDFMTKKTVCKFAAVVAEGTDSENIGTTSGSYQLANLPADAIITDAYVHVKTASDAATSAVATLGTTEGGSEIASAIDLAVTGEQGTFTGQSLTSTGVPLILNTTITGAATAVGEYIVVVNYLEYTKDTGEYTRI